MKKPSAIAVVWHSGDGIPDPRSEEPDMSSYYDITDAGLAHLLRTRCEWLALIRMLGRREGAFE
jgi:hypothetical protein